ncbi:MAG: hypothetical protein ACFE0S_04605 [Rhodospirillales bacterium]
MERTLGYLIGIVVAGAILLGLALAFGGVIIGLVSALLAFPLAAPMTTSALVVALAIGYLAYRRKKRRDQDRP